MVITNCLYPFLENRALGHTMPFMKRFTMAIQSPISLYKDFAKRKKPDLTGFIINLLILVMLITFASYIQESKLYLCYLQLVGGKITDVRRFLWLSKIIPSAFRYTVLLMIYLMMIIIVPYATSKWVLKRDISFSLLLSIEGYLLVYLWIGLLISLIFIAKAPKLENILIYPFMFTSLLVIIREYASQPSVALLMKASRIVNTISCILAAILLMLSFKYIITDEKRELIILYIVTVATIALLIV
ncbi:MAG: hypothetical protein DRZ82_05355 [Thermoprotei archaeon]|nr:MAG: hypothetical protein DRZ82_05355 [Thermoprotei archaeon]